MTSPSKRYRKNPNGGWWLIVKGQPMRLVERKLCAVCDQPRERPSRSYCDACRRMTFNRRNRDKRLERRP
jgi:hypothetical protein